jgi:hypothetical protein
MMDRRQIIVGTAAAAAWAGWARDALAAAPSQRQSELFAAWHRARRLGAPLLVIVVSDDDGRAFAIGGALTDASPKLVNRLEGYVPACGTVEDLALLGAVVAPETWFVTLDTAVPTTASPLPLPAHPTPEAVERLLLTSLPERAGVVDAVNAWVRERLPGSYWAVEGSCGYHIEQYEEQVLYLCGVGSFSESSRFLHFYVRALDE